MADSTLWWLLTGALVALELLTGTFYLLMLALGAAAAALVAHTGAAQTAQIVVAALVGLGAVLGLTWLRRRRPGDPSVRAQRSVNLDVGEVVQVDAWQTDGTAQVKYRGASWTVVLPAGTTPAPGPHRVTELVGSRLLVEKV
ncbi:MAG: NfeD family protein [Hydrogenophaga sp.]|uniref:NfeD family protein n=1 Tax=Hydrogenophaga sp. TaxID=1904254 RepID=UPI003D9B3E28